MSNPRGPLDGPTPDVGTADTVRTGPPSGARAVGEDLTGVTVDRLIPVDRGLYENQGEFARGGFGRILRALDRRTGRVVAIKELRRASGDVLPRFAREALVTARLQHPFIIPVYEVGRWSDREPFYAMKLVKGRSLEDLISEAPDTHARLALLAHVIHVADALAYAHGEQVIHRDLKPANVLVGAYGETVVIDWGLARNLAAGDAPEAVPSRVGPHGAQGETVAGTVMGTPAYMPPEQARGEPVDARADVYAIGAMLYHVLGGAAPYQGEGNADVVLMRVIAGPPVPLTTLAPDLPPELVTIVARAMAPDPDKRYPSAQELAADLRRYQAGQLVQAHRYTLWELVRRWTLRNRPLVGSALAAMVSLGVFGAYSVRRITVERDEAMRQRTAAVRAQASARSWAGQGIEEFAREALLAHEPGRALPLLAGSWAYRPAGTPALRFLAGQARDAFAAITTVAPATSDAVLWAARSPDGALVFSLGTDHGLHAWDVRAHRAGWDATGYVTVGLSTDGGLLAAGRSDGTVDVLGAPTGTVLGHVTLGPGEEASALDWSADGARFAAGGLRGAVGVWSAAAPWVGVSHPRVHAGTVRDVHFSPDGQSVATTGDDGAVVLTDAMTGQQRVQWHAHTGRVDSAVWLGGDRVVSGGNDGAVTVWSAGTGRSLATWAAGGAVYQLAVDAQGTRVAAAVVDPAVRVWDVASGAVVATLGGHAGSANAVLFSGDRVVTADEVGVLRRWDVPTGRVLETVPADGVIYSLLPSGRAVVAGGRSSRVRVLAMAADQGLVSLVGHVAMVRRVVFDPTGAVLYSASNDGQVRAWDVAGGGVRWSAGTFPPEPDVAPPGPDAPPPPLPHGVRGLSLSPDHTVLATSAEDGTVTLREAATGTVRGTLTGHVGRVREVQFSDDGATVVTAGADGTVRVWDAVHGSERTRLDVGGPVQTVRWLANGHRVVVVGEDRSLQVWDPVTRTRTDHGGLPAEYLVEVPVTRGGLVVAASREAVRLIDPTQGTVVGEVGVPFVTAVDVSPDGAVMALGTTDGTVSLVDVGARGVTRSWHAHDGPVTALHFRPDGALLASAARDGVVKIWEPVSARVLAVSPVLPGVLLHLAWDPAGRTLAVAGVSSTVWCWHLRPDDGTALALARRARCVSPWQVDGTNLVAARPDPASCDP